MPRLPVYSRSRSTVTPTEAERCWFPWFNLGMTIARRSTGNPRAFDLEFELTSEGGAGAKLLCRSFRSGQRPSLAAPASLEYLHISTHLHRVPKPAVGGCSSMRVCSSF